MQVGRWLALVALVVSGTAFAQGGDKDDKGKKGDTVSAVLERLYVADKGEINMGKLAQTNGGTRSQEYGRMLEKDHQMLLEQVQQLAQQKNVTLTDQPKDKDAGKQMKESAKVHEKLSKKQGADFDKDFAKAMVDDHKKDIDNLKKWGPKVGDAELTQLIDKTIPVLQKHLDRAEQLREAKPQARTPEPMRR